MTLHKVLIFVSFLYLENLTLNLSYLDLIDHQILSELSFHAQKFVQSLFFQHLFTLAYSNVNYRIISMVFRIYY